MKDQESIKPSYVDEVKQNEDICLKYGLNFCNAGYVSGPKKEVCEVIKMLEVKLFSAEASLKLSQELNASYENIIRALREELQEEKTSWDGRI